MAEKIGWEYYNPKESLENMMASQYNDYEDDEDEPRPMPESKLMESPLFPNDYWIGHTNFKINKDHVFKLNYKAVGLESFRVLSPYRLIVAIGKMFEWSDVRLGIEKLLCNRHITYTENTKLNNDIQELKTQLDKYKYWAILMLPNGKISYCKSNSKDDTFNLEYNRLSKLTEFSNAILIESETCKSSTQ